MPHGDAGDAETQFDGDGDRVDGFEDDGDGGRGRDQRGERVPRRELDILSAANGAVRGKLDSRPAPEWRPSLRRSAIAEASRHQPVQPFDECIRVCRALAIQDAGGIQEEVGHVAP